MKSVRVSWDLVGAWELWTIDIPDDAPTPLTAEWLEANWDKCEFYDLKDRGHDRMINPIIEED